ncbi:hypothetical protein KY290_026012 [Solanum tuberosum]|uniref:Uncharacterized protein n=1 Tax=Solanum tuberosum TaxID=4113 RepID=A0ABQ7UV73_SOLTU|nr:hypothetical protein KY289_025097 [Solanum tuberosum]KAH0755742.1 hypothetical protein KY290_026012 [Solanum tuberosum]
MVGFVSGVTAPKLINHKRIHTPKDIIDDIREFYKFQLDEIPCAHAVVVLKDKNVTDMHPYCSDYYKPDALAKTYEVPVIPMPDKEDWSVPSNVIDEIVWPPRYKRLAGRPRKRRKKMQMKR